MLVAVDWCQFTSDTNSYNLFSMSLLWYESCCTHSGMCFKATFTKVCKKLYRVWVNTLIENLYYLCSEKPRDRHQYRFSVIVCSVKSKEQSPHCRNSRHVLKIYTKQYRNQSSIWRFFSFLLLYLLNQADYNCRGVPDQMWTVSSSCTVHSSSYLPSQNKVFPV